jgi:predicted lipid-binding transport protein (Tim44 family)
MNLLIQQEYYRELLKDPNPGRMIEGDAEEAAEDQEMWTKGW